MRRDFDAWNIAECVCKRLQRKLFTNGAIGAGRLLELIPETLFGSRIGRTRFAIASRGHSPLRVAGALTEGCCAIRPVSNVMAEGLITNPSLHTRWTASMSNPILASRVQRDLDEMRTRTI